jgi:hypothetical protein
MQTGAHFRERSRRHVSRCCSRNYLLSCLLATYGLEPVRSTALPHAQHKPPRAECELKVRLRRESSRADI